MQSTALNKALWAMAAIALSAIMVQTYHGNYAGQYVELFPYLMDPSLFKYDIYIQKSTVLNATILYPLLSYFKFPIHINLISFPLHLIFCFIAVFYTYKLIFEVIAVKNTLTGILLLFLFCTSSMILPQVKDSIFMFHTVTPTWIAHAAVMPAIYYFLTGRYLISSLLMCFMVMMTAKQYAILLPIFCLTLAFRKEWKKSVLFALPTVVYIAFKLITEPLSYPPEMASEIIDFIIYRNSLEDAFHLNGPYNLFFFIGILTAYGILLHKVKDPFRKSFLLAILVVGQGLFIGGYLYVYKLHEYWPQPILILLSPVRSSFIIFIGAKMLLATLVATEQRQHPSIWLCLVLMILGSSVLNSRLILGVCLLASLGALALALMDWNRLKVWLQERSPAFGAMILCITTVAISYYSVKAAIRQHEEHGVWDHALANTCVDYLKNVEGDFILHDINPAEHPYLSAPSGYQHIKRKLGARTLKSKYLGEAANFYFSPEMITVDRGRRDSLKQIKNQLIAGKRLSIAKETGLQAPFLFMLPDIYKDQVSDQYVHQIPQCPHRVMVSSFPLKDKNIAKKEITPQPDTQKRHN